MFTEWDFNSMTGSLVTVLFMGGIITGFGALLCKVLAGIFREETEAVDMLAARRQQRESPLREAA